MIANSARRILIHIGRALPFVLCSLVFASYAEQLLSLMFDRYVEYDGYTYLDTSVTSTIATYIKYDMLGVFVVFIISVAIETCRWNMLATAYLFVNLIEKEIFTFEFEEWPAFLFLASNMLTSLYFSCKGVGLFLKRVNKFGKSARL